MKVFAGPFIESTGSSPPFLVTPYVSLIVFLGIFIPICAMAHLALHGQATVGLCSLGLYVMQLLAQIKSEGVYLRKGMPHTPCASLLQASMC